MRRRRGGALRVSRSIRNARSPSAIATTTATRGARRGSRAFPPTRIRHPSHRGAAMSPVPLLTGAICRGRPCLRRFVVPRCRRRAGHGRRGTTVVGSSSHPAAPLVRVGLQSTRSRTAPSGTGTLEPPRSAPRQIDPLRRSEECSVPVRQLYDSSDRPNSNFF
jgi:hypothetical protein